MDQRTQTTDEGPQTTDEGPQTTDEGPQTTDHIRRPMDNGDEFGPVHLAFLTSFFDRHSNH